MKDSVVRHTDSMHGAMQALNRWQKGVMLVVDQEDRLVGTVSDGDIRRAILAGFELHTPLTELLARQGGNSICSADDGTGGDYGPRMCCA